MVTLTGVLRAGAAALLICCGVPLLGACDGGDGDSSAQDAKHGQKQTDSAGNRIDADMVSAVTSGKAPGQVALKFALTQRPEIGQPIDINLALIPLQELDQVFASFQASDGLELRSGAKTPTYEHPEPGAPISHTLTVVPSHDGIFYVTGVILSDSENLSVARTFSIPLIAGAGLSVTSADKATPSVTQVPAANLRHTR